MMGLTAAELSRPRERKQRENHMANVPTAPKSMPAATVPNRAPAPTTRPTSRIAGAASAEARRQSEWYQPGEYLVEVLKVAEGDTRKGRGFFVTDSRVRMNTEKFGGPTNQTKVGRTASHMIMLDFDGADGQIRSILEALCTAEELELVTMRDVGEDEAAIKAEVERVNANLAIFTGPNSPLKGRLAQVVAEATTTKKGLPFTAIRWFRATPEMLEAAGIQAT